MNSTTSDNPKRSIRIWSVAVWILIWHGLSAIIGKEVLLASPVSVVHRLSQLMMKIDFWKSILFSVGRIVSGLLLAIVVAVFFAVLSVNFKRVEEFLAPIIMIFTATPVASITILALIWISSRNLSVLVSFMMVLPIIYTNVQTGIKNTDSLLLEMAAVFQVPVLRKVSHIYIPQVMPYFQSACLVGIGLCWKAGVAAEVIGIPKSSIGEQLYMAKIYLATADLFAWTLTIIIISIAFERLFMLLMGFFAKRIERM